jgi:hypothetical protein
MGAHVYNQDEIDRNRTQGKVKFYQAVEKPPSTAFPSSFVACALKRFVAQASLQRT